MQPKKKRPVDPNAPPRPNLLSHDKTIRAAQQTIEQQANQIARLTQKVEELERKLNHQTQYLQAVHSRLTK